MDDGWALEARSPLAGGMMSVVRQYLVAVADETEAHGRVHKLFGGNGDLLRTLGPIPAALLQEEGLSSGDVVRSDLRIERSGAQG